MVHEPEKNVYNKLIEYALAKSDAFMLITIRYLSHWENEFKSAESINPEFKEKLWQIKKQCMLDQKIFAEKTEPFLKKLHPYRLKQRHTPVEWPSTHCLGKSGNVDYDISVFQACKAIQPYLLEPGGLFQWKYPHFPEDLCFFYGGYCWLSTSAHERSAEIYVSTQEEVEEIKQLGLDLRCIEEDFTLFYEEY